jgi:hypothetical protein
MSKIESLKSWSRRPASAQQISPRFETRLVQDAMPNPANTTTNDNHHYQYKEIFYMHTIEKVRAVNARIAELRRPPQR